MLKRIPEVLITIQKDLQTGLHKDYPKDTWAVYTALQRSFDSFSRAVSSQIDRTIAKTKFVGLTSDLYETGMEGTAWIVQDYEWIDKETGMWSHKGIAMVEEGDTLLVYKGKSLIFHDVIRLEPPPPNWAGNINRYGKQKGMEYTAWIKLFTENNHAILFKAGHGEVNGTKDTNSG